MPALIHSSQSSFIALAVSAIIIGLFSLWNSMICFVASTPSNMGICLSMKMRSTLWSFVYWSAFWPLSTEFGVYPRFVR